VHAETTQLPKLAFDIESAQAVSFAAAPTVAFALRVSSDLPVRSLALNAQIRIAPARRRYTAHDQERLVDLFGPPERWGETLRTFRWAQVPVLVPPFTGSTLVEVPVSCTYDFEVATAKYFYALEDGEIPLEFLFSGTIFYLAEGARLQTAQVPWECEAAFRLPVQIWKSALDAHFPQAAWLRVRDDVFARLAQYKARHALPTWEATFDELLDGRE
jgi:hypothetical protein